MNTQVSLVVEKGNDAGKVFDLSLPAIVGRAPTCAVMLHDADASRQHCLIEHDAGEFTLKDSGSANGTFLNGARIASVALRNNDLIEVGATTLRFVIGAVSRVPPGPQVLAVARPTLAEPPFHNVDSRSGAEVLALALTKYKVLYQVNALLGRVTDLDAFYPLVLEQLLEVFSGDEAALHLGAVPETVQTVASRAREGISASPLVSTTLLRRVYAGEAVLVLDAALDARLYGAESVMGKAVRSLLCAPLSHHGVVLGALQLESNRRIGAFDENDLQLFAAIAQQVAAGLATLTAARQRDEAVARARLRRTYSEADAERELIARSPAAQRRRLVCVYADLSALSSLVTAGAPEVLVAALNQTLEPIVEEVFSHGGSLGRLGGDGLLAFWGLTSSRDDDAVRATRAALAMSHVFASAAEAAGWPARVRTLSLGISVGLTVVGTIGVSVRTDVSAFGGPVEEAVRLALQAQGEVLVSQAMRSELGASATVESRPPGYVVVQCEL